MDQSEGQSQSNEGPGLTVGSNSSRVVVDVSGSGGSLVADLVKTIGCACLLGECADTHHLVRLNVVDL